MSQKKVDKYKAGKYDRNRTSKKERLIDRLEILAWVVICVATVSYTHLDVYKRQMQNCLR